MERIWNNLELFYYNVAKIAEPIIKEACEDKSHDIVFIYLLVFSLFLITIGHIKPISRTFSLWLLDD